MASFTLTKLPMIFWISFSNHPSDRRPYLSKNRLFTQWISFTSMYQRANSCSSISAVPVSSKCSHSMLLTSSSVLTASLTLFFLLLMSVLIIESTILSTSSSSSGGSQASSLYFNALLRTVFFFSFLPSMEPTNDANVLLRLPSLTSSGASNGLAANSTLSPSSSHRNFSHSSGSSATSFSKGSYTHSYVPSSMTDGSSRVCVPSA